MWNKMNLCRCAMALFLLAFCFLGAGCWILRSWKDYVPITEVGLRKDMRTYTGCFYPKITGRHTLALRVKKNGSSDYTTVGLRFRGAIKLFHAGCETIIPFDETIGRVTLPPTPFNLHLKTFEACAIERSQDYGMFNVTIDGDIDGFLEREPDSHLSVSFCDAE